MCVCVLRLCVYVHSLTFIPPLSSLSFSLSGVAADAKVGSDLIRVQAIDNDVGNNSLVLYHVLSIRYIKLQSNDTEDIGNSFIIGQSLPTAKHDYYLLCVCIVSLVNP